MPGSVKESNSNEIESISNDYNNSTVTLSDDSSDCEFLGIEGVEDGEHKWRDVNSPIRRLNSLFQAGYNNPKLLLTRLFGVDEMSIPTDSGQMWGLLLTLLSEPTPRRRLRHISTLDKVVELLRSCKSILVVTGAGVSVSCGIPDFRSRDGIYARLAKDYPDLSSPQSMFDMEYFKRHPEPFFKFAKEIFPGQFRPSVTHYFVAFLEHQNKLLRNYTQNIDTLEQAAGITRLIQCHGSFASATCTHCGYKVPGDAIKDQILSQSIPYCNRCSSDESRITENSQLSSGDPNTSFYQTGDQYENSVQTCSITSTVGILKPDIVFFGEDLSSEFHNTLAADVKQVDLLLVIGSSLKVRPVAHIPNCVPEHIPQILINREPLFHHNFDVELLGDCDVIVEELCYRLGWKPENISVSTGKREISLHELYSKVVRNCDDESAQLAVQNPSIHVEDIIPDRSQSQEKTIEVSNTVEAPIEISNDSLEPVENDQLWDVGASLPSDAFTHIDPNQYVFTGAEVLIEGNPDSDNLPCSSSDSSSEELLEVSETANLGISAPKNSEDRFLNRLLEQCEVDPMLQPEVASFSEKISPMSTVPDNKVDECDADNPGTELISVLLPKRSRTEPGGVNSSCNLPS